ncbi:hypothetical protein F0L88_23240 [Shigella sonnei]|uniref:Uncharacterized protein n=4 Tax=Acinetobacter baumannii TaxID=470 RepID=A0A4R5QUY7_ACIBA|nr:hypothetical protein ACICU_00232 [Acinetobacter baumannii ACICU]ARG30285.1 hypothetical protein B7L41_03255 [Acinetobacter baumannii]ATT08026.1 hypothetical protein BTN68_23895 [Salmonella enterica subsp. enterica serovar Enteritidis]EAB1030777.1 hypothetical protein [Shigella sonnei]EFD5448736.1 hypothetical protein [Escherichia coli]EKW0402836.1 hypothetical protein [Proteus mirabilis]EMT92205.1 hypothetical protein ABNIH6_19357 [Acinetobacter baumannii ABNIH6]EMT94097.1 hypothetical pr
MASPVFGPYCRQDRTARPRNAGGVRRDAPAQGVPGRFAVVQRDRHTAQLTNGGATMFNIALSRLLNAAYGPTRCLASVGAWVFGFYGCLILAMAMAAGQVAESFPVYGKPLALATGLVILRRLARRH